MTEAAAALLGLAFTPRDDAGLGLRRIEVRCAASNEASRRTAERLGFRHEGTLRQERWFEDTGWDDGLIFAVLQDEWPTKQVAG